jgi:zinc protease
MKNKNLIVLTCLMLLSALLRAAVPQDVAPPDVSSVERKNRAPVSKDILRVKLPRATEMTLSNGLTVLVIEDHRLPLVSLQYNISAAGPIFEPANLPGLASATAQMLREGTKTRNSVQIAEEIAQLGASVSASSSFGSSATVISASGLSDNFEKWFTITNDLLLNPSFPAEELNRFKSRLKPQIAQQRTSSSFLSNEMFSRTVYGNHPASIVSPTIESIDALTPEILAKWHREHYAPQNAILGFIGDVRATELKPKLEKWLAEWKKSDLKEVLPPNPRPVSSSRVILVNRPNSVQTRIMLGNISIDRRDPDYVPLTVTNQVIGGGAAARLFLNLREQKGYTYGVYSSFSALKYPGPWRAYGDVRTEVTGPAMDEFFREIQRIRDEIVPESELGDAKRSLVASFALSLEDPEQLLGYAIIQKIYGFPADYWDAYPAKIMAVTPVDVQNAARKYINPANIQIVAVGDVSKIKGPMGKYGQVEIYDAEGKKQGN